MIVIIYFYRKNNKLKKGTVIKSTGSWYKLMTEDNEFWDCRIRGKLRLFIHVRGQFVIPFSHKHSEAETTL